MAAVERSSAEESQPVLGAAATPSELPDMERGGASVTQKRLFLVASNVPDKADLIAATKAWVTTVQYDYERGLGQDALRWIGPTTVITLGPPATGLATAHRGRTTRIGGGYSC